MLAALKKTWTYTCSLWKYKEVLLSHIIFSTVQFLFFCGFVFNIMNNRLNLIFALFLLAYTIIYEPYCFIGYYNIRTKEDGESEIKTLKFLKENIGLVGESILFGIFQLIIVSFIAIIYSSFSESQNLNTELLIFTIFFLIVLYSAFNTLLQKDIFKAVTQKKYCRNDLALTVFNIWKYYLMSFYFVVLFTVLPLICGLLWGLPWMLGISIAFFVVVSCVFHDLMVWAIFMQKYNKNQSSLGRKTKDVQLHKAKKLSFKNLLGFGNK